MAEKREISSVAAHWLHMAESVVLVLIAIVLIIVAVFLLGQSALSIVTLLRPEQAGTVRSAAIDILDSVLLVMMTMEIVYTVAVSLESHSLVAEPFLIIGAIAAIRRMLVITAESTQVQAAQAQAAQNYNLLLELGLLALIVIAMSISIYVLRRSARFLPPESQEPSTE